MKCYSAEGGSGLRGEEAEGYKIGCTADSDDMFNDRRVRIIHRATTEAA